MTKIDKFIQDFKLFDDMEKKEAVEKIIVSYHPINVCLALRHIVENDDDVVCKPILRRVVRYIGRIK